MNEVTKTSLALDDDVRDAHFAAKSREPNNQLDGVDVMSNDDELGLLGFDKSGHVVETELENLGLLALDGLSLGFSSSLNKKSVLLLLLGFRAVASQKTKQVGGRGLLQSLCELSNGRGDLDTLL